MKMYNLDSILNYNDPTSGTIQPQTEGHELLLAGVRAFKTENVFRIWEYLEQQMARNEDHAARSVLKVVRDQFATALFSQKLETVKLAFDTSVTSGWQCWVTVIAEALGNFRGKFAEDIAAANFSLPADLSNQLKTLRDGITYFNNTRWSEFYAELNFLLTYDFLPRTLRALLQVVAGQIELYWLAKSETANASFEKAAAMLPNDGFVTCAMGEYCLQSQQTDRAKELFTKAIQQNPEVSLSYVRYGDALEMENNIPASIEWAKLQSLHENLMRLYGRQDQFQSHESELESLLYRAIETNPENEYGLYLTIGQLYETNEKFEKAHEFYSKAIVLDPAKMEGYLREGYCFGSENNSAASGKMFETCQRLFPEVLDGYLGLSWLRNREKDINGSVEILRTALVNWPESSVRIRTQIADILWQAGKDAEAIGELQLALPEDESNTIFYTLENYAIESYSKRSNVAGAIGIYDHLLAHFGEAYRADYHNRVGNLKYFLNDFESAATSYAAAIAAAPTNVFFINNLSLAYRELKNWKAAIEQLEKIRSINHDEQSFNRETALVLNAAGNDLYEKTDYAGAIEQYQLSIAHYDQYEVVFKNMASAYEYNWQAGSWTESLDKAIAALRRSAAIVASPELSASINRLLNKRDFISQFGETAGTRVNDISQIYVEVSPDLVPYIQNSGDGNLLENISSRINRMKENVFSQFGVKVPAIRFRAGNESLTGGNYVLLLMEVPIATGNVPLTGNAYPDTANTIISQLQQVIVDHLASLVGFQEIISLLGGDYLPRDLKTESIRKLTAFTNICRGLVGERFSINAIRDLFEEFEVLFSTSEALLAIQEKLRQMPDLTTAVAGNEELTNLVGLSNDFESALAAALYSDQGNQVLALTPEFCKDALTDIGDGIQGDDQKAIVVNTAVLRPFVKKLIELDYPTVSVLNRTATTKPVTSVIELSAKEVSAPFKPRTTTTGNDAPTTQEVRDAFPAITLKINRELLSKKVSPEASITEIAFQMSDGLFYELGLIVPNIDIVYVDSEDENITVVQLGTAIFHVSGIGNNEFLVSETPERLKLLRITGRPQVNPANGNVNTVVSDMSCWPTCIDAGLTVWGPAGYVILQLAALIRAHAPVFQTASVTSFMLNALQPTHAELVSVARVLFPDEKLAAILKDLLSEQISIRNLPGILDSLISIQSTNSIDTAKYLIFSPDVQGICFVDSGALVTNISPGDFADYVRMQMRRYISYKYARGQSSLLVYVLDNALELRLCDMIERPLSKEESDELIQSVCTVIRDSAYSTQKPVILASHEVRRRLANLLKKDLPEIAVLSYQELSPELSIQPIAKITWDQVEV